MPKENQAARGDKVAKLILRAVLLLGRLALVERGKERLSAQDLVEMYDGLFSILEEMNDEVQIRQEQLPERNEG